VVPDSEYSRELKHLQEGRGEPAPVPVQEAAAFYQKRLLFYRSLLLLVILVGVPMLAVPPLRQRLLGRIQVLREAASSSGRAAAMTKIGENPIPFPQEYARKVEPVQPAPQIPSVVYPSNRTYSPLLTPPAPAETRKSPSRPRVVPKLINEPRTAQEPEQPAETAAASDEPEFRQGRIEQEAYDVILQANATVAGLVRGADPTMQFKNWAAAKIEEDLYYVRLNFTRKDGEASFIWQVKLLSKQVTPLNFNARSLPSK
jgi:hypothetical protein